MKKLLKKYGLFSDMQYFEMIVKKMKEGDKEGAKCLFLELPKNEKKNFINSNLGNWNSGLTSSNLSIFVAAL